MPCLQNTQKRPFPGRESQVEYNRGSTVLQVRHSHFPFSFDLSTVESACCDMCYFLFASLTSIYCQLHLSSLFATTDTLTTTTLLFSFSMLHVIDRPGTLHLSRISNHYTTCYRNSDFSVPLLSHLPGTNQAFPYSRLPTIQTVPKLRVSSLCFLVQLEAHQAQDSAPWPTGS